MCIHVDLFIFFFKKNILAFCVWIFIYFLSLGKNSAIIYLNKFPAPFSLFLRPYNLIMYNCLIVSHKYLKLFLLYFLKLFFHFSPLAGWILLPCSNTCWLFLLLDLVCYWTSVLNFSIQLLYYFILWFLVSIFEYFLSFCSDFYFVHAFLSWPWR